jgi:FKBP-type peptidyl-prolyl cis-trans isomerase 2
MTFKITVEAVREATAEEIETGLVIEQQLDDQSKPVVH